MCGPVWSAKSTLRTRSVVQSRARSLPVENESLLGELRGAITCDPLGMTFLAVYRANICQTTSCNSFPVRLPRTAFRVVPTKGDTGNGERNEQK